MTVRDRFAVPLDAQGRVLAVPYGDSHGVIIGGYVPAGIGWPEGWAVIVVSFGVWAGCIDAMGRLDADGGQPVIGADDIVAVAPCPNLRDLPDDIAVGALDGLLASIARDLDALRRDRARGWH